MPVRHHPAAQVRADYVAANLAPGAALAVRTHLDFCSVCAIAVQAMDGFSGAESMGAEVARPSGSQRETSRDRRISESLPHPLRATPRGPWRRLSAKAVAAQLEGVSGLGETAWLVEVSRGGRLPGEPHGQLWGGVLLMGSLRAGEAMFSAGDFLDLQGAPVELRAEADALLLLVGDDSWAQPRWQSLLARLKR